MGLLFGSAGAQTYLKSGQVAPFLPLSLHHKNFDRIPTWTCYKSRSKEKIVDLDMINNGYPGSAFPKEEAITGNPVIQN